MEIKFTAHRNALGISCAQNPMDFVAPSKKQVF